ncbi:MAG: orotidine-5'-phosphate decarboxylase [Solirubrobacteraceae bacterium]
MAGAGGSASPFGDRLAAAVSARESQIVLGIDPDPSALWPRADQARQTRAAPRDRAASDASVAARDAASDASLRAASAVLAHSRALIDAAGPACVAAKLQLACFERLGVGGAQALADTVEYARDAGLLVIADGKRGDIDVSVRAYAEAQFGGSHAASGQLSGLRVDAATINPLMGADTLVAALSVARAAGGGIFVLVRTSNPGAADVLDLPVASVPVGLSASPPGEVAGSRDPKGAVAATVWERLALIVAQLGEVGVGGLADVGAVVGATEPHHFARARELMPHAPFLLPGIGAQGGRVEELAPVFAGARGLGLVSASRSIADAHTQAGGTPANAARAEAERLRELAWRLSE